MTRSIAAVDCSAADGIFHGVSCCWSLLRIVDAARGTHGVSCCWSLLRIDDAARRERGEGRRDRAGGRWSRTRRWKLCCIICLGQISYQTQLLCCSYFNRSPFHLDDTYIAARQSSPPNREPPADCTSRIQLWTMHASGLLRRRRRWKHRMHCQRRVK